MSAGNKDAPRRYIVDSTGRRVLVGLTIEETIEFERLDSPAAHRLHVGGVLWDDANPVQPEQRWVELYARHEQAWSQWMARAAPVQVGSPIFSTEWEVVRVSSRACGLHGDGSSEARFRAPLPVHCHIRAETRSAKCGVNATRRIEANSKRSQSQ